MDIVDKIYSESELRNKNSEDTSFSLGEVMYSENEVTQISEMFNEFYSEHGDEYTDVEEAYDNFLDAYSELKLKKKKPFKLTKRQSQVGTAGAGMAAGFAIGSALSIKDKKKMKEIKKKMRTGMASASDMKELERLKKRINTKKGVGAALGAGAGLGAHALYGYKGRKEAEKKFSSEFEDFEDFYAEFEDIYQDNIEDAYNDYVDVINMETSEDDSYTVINSARKAGASAYRGKVHGTALGAIAGGAGANLATKKWKEQLDSLQYKANQTEDEKQKIKVLKAKIAGVTAAGAIGGGLIGNTVGGRLAKRRSKKKLANYMSNRNAFQKVRDAVSRRNRKNKRYIKS